MHTSYFTAIIGTLLSLTAPSTASVPHYPGWRLTWHDDFKGQHLNLRHWKIDRGHSYTGGPANWGTGEIQRYTSSRKNLHVKGGLLYIKPLRTRSGGWTSARIATRKGGFMAREGHKMKIEARISIPRVGTHDGLGYWPAFWTCGSHFRHNFTNWPAVGELDIMENVNGYGSTSSTFHCGTTPGGPCNEPIGIGARQPCRGSNCNGHWHKYSVVVDRKSKPEKIRFFADGKQRLEVTSASMDSATWARAVHHGHYIILNVAMGGAYPNGADLGAGGSGQTPTGATVNGRPMKVDYVAVYEH